MVDAWSTSLIVRALYSLVITYLTYFLISELIGNKKRAFLTDSLSLSYTGIHFDQM